MEFVGHKKIKNFSMDGVIHNDADFIRVRYQYQNLIESYMRVKGYVPHLDLDIVFTTNYNGKTFEFKITSYGIYIGKAKAKCYAGVTSNQLVPMIPTIQNKSTRSSLPAEFKLDQN